MAVCAGDVAVSFGGVIGGPGHRRRRATHNVLLEAADVGRPHHPGDLEAAGVRTDASALNEKGLSDTLPPIALDRAAALIAELGGGHVLQDTVDVRARELPPIPPIAVSGAAISRAARLPGRHHRGGHGAGPARLRRRAARRRPHRHRASFPPRRPHRRGRGRGGGALARLRPRAQHPAGPAHRGRRLAAETPAEDRVKDVLIGAGYDEAITWSFTVALAGGRPPGRRRRAARRSRCATRSARSGVCCAPACSPGSSRRSPATSGAASRTSASLSSAAPSGKGERRGTAPGSTPDGPDGAFAPLPAEPLLLTAAATAAGAAQAAARLRDLQATVARARHELGAGAVETVPARGSRAARRADRGGSSAMAATSAWSASSTRPPWRVSMCAVVSRWPRSARPLVLPERGAAPLPGSASPPGGGAGPIGDGPEPARWPATP